MVVSILHNARYGVKRLYRIARFYRFEGAVHRVAPKIVGWWPAIQHPLGQKYANNLDTAKRDKTFNSKGNFKFRIHTKRFKRSNGCGTDMSSLQFFRPNWKCSTSSHLGQIMNYISCMIVKSTVFIVQRIIARFYRHARSDYRLSLYPIP